MRSSTSKPCHNCRRRRLRCDRSWPSCHKCAVSGQECLGYGKVFVWTQGNDGQGNVKSVAAPDSSRPEGDAGSLAPTPPELGKNGGEPHGLRRGGSSLPGTQLHATRQGTVGTVSSDDQDDDNKTRLAGGEDEKALRAGHEHHRPPPTTFPISAAGTAVDNDTDASLTQQLLHRSGSRDTVFGNLTDPVFQDLDRRSRYYLAHCKRLPHLTSGCSLSLCYPACFPDAFDLLVALHQATTPANLFQARCPSWLGRPHKFFALPSFHTRYDIFASRSALPRRTLIMHSTNQLPIECAGT